MICKSCGEENSLVFENELKNGAVSCRCDECGMITKLSKQEAIKSGILD